MDPAISDLALDLGQFALDSELEMERERTRPSANAQSEKPNRPGGDLFTISHDKQSRYNSPGGDH